MPIWMALVKCDIHTVICIGGPSKAEGRERRMTTVDQ